MTARNVAMSWAGPILTLTIDTDEDYGLTSTGRSIQVASTGGFLWENEVGISLNIIKKKGNK